MLVKPRRRTLTDATVTAISDAIREKKFPPGSQLPSELELMTMLGVSRTTLREALRTLEEQNSINRRRGLGTFVSERSIVKDLSINFGITEMITQAGFTPKTIKCEIRKEDASGKVAKNLEIRRRRTHFRCESFKTGHRYTDRLVAGNTAGRHAGWQDARDAGT